MSANLSVLIVEDDPMVALGLAFAAEDAGAIVIGPAASAHEALSLLTKSIIDAAILDVHLVDGVVTPVALALLDCATPFIVHTGIGLPDELATTRPTIAVVMKPTLPDQVVQQLLAEVARKV